MFKWEDQFGRIVRRTARRISKELEKMEADLADMPEAWDLSIALNVLASELIELQPSMIKLLFHYVRPPGHLFDG
jgi:hypothetical protein